MRHPLALLLHRNRRWIPRPHHDRGRRTRRRSGRRRRGIAGARQGGKRREQKGVGGEPMPPADGRAGNVCVYLVSCLLFLAILGGGALLVLYIALPESEGTAWFPIAGMVLVGTPWAFWIVTCLYRAASTTAGTVHKDDADRARAPGRDTTPAAVVSTEPGIPAVAAIHQDPVEVNSPGGAARRVRFGAATLLGSPREATAGGSPSGKPDEEPPSSGDGSSHASHESELPLFAAS